MIARASSGSRASISSIEPLMSANNAVTVLRSPSITSATGCSPNKRIPAPEDGLVAIASERTGAVLRLVPHFLQNRAPALTGAWQAGQSSSSLHPHCSQKAESEGFSLPQFEHRISFDAPLSRHLFLQDER